MASCEDRVVSLEDVYIPFTFLEELLEEVEREEIEEGVNIEGHGGEGNMNTRVENSDVKVVREVEGKDKFKEFNKEDELLPGKITAYGEPSKAPPYIEWSMVPKEKRRQDPMCPWSAWKIPESEHMTRTYEEPPLFGKCRSDGRYGLVKKYRPGQYGPDGNRSLH